MNARLKKLLLTALKFGIPIAILWYLVSTVTPDQWSTLRSSPKNYTFLASALGIGIIATVISYLRWGLLVRSHRIPISAIESIRLGSIGFLLNFVSAGAVGGDVFKAYFLARRNAGKKIEAFASALVDRIVGLYGLLIVSSVALIFIGDAIEGSEATVIRIVIFGSTVAGAVVMLGIVWGGQVIDSVLDRLGRLAYIGPFVHRVADPLRAFRDHTVAFMLAIAMAVAVHCLLALSIHFIAAGLYPSHPSLDQHLVVVPLANAFAALPISPGGVGVFEGALQQLYRAMPQISEDISGTVVGLVYEIVKFLIAAMGVVMYWTGGNEMRESMREAEEQEADADADIGASSP